MAAEPPPKEDVARALLLRGSVYVHLDPRLDEVEVPTWLTGQPQLVLQVGLDLPLPIPDLRVDSEGVFGTLSFNRSPFTCMVPWEAVFALLGDDGMGMVWVEDMPPEIVAELHGSAGRVDASAADIDTPSERPRRPHLRAIDGGSTRDESGQQAAESTEEDEPPPRKRPHLRLIK